MKHFIKIKCIEKKEAKFIFLITVLALFVNPSFSQSITVYPDFPIHNNPLTAGIGYSTGDSIYEYEWLVNSAVVKQGITTQTFRVNFENEYYPLDDNELIESPGLELVEGWFGDAVHIGSGGVHLAYANNNKISTDSGSISFWFALDYDIDNPIYRKWNTLFNYSIDANNSLTISFNDWNNSLLGVSQSNGIYNSVGLTPENYKFLANEWHHLVWTWDKQTAKQRLYIDGKWANSAQNYVAPVGISNEFIVGSGKWPGTLSSFSTIDEFRVFSKSLSGEEVKALFQYPDKDIDAFLEADNFKNNDTVVFRYRSLNNGTWSEYNTSDNLLVVENPISFQNTVQDVLLPGQTEAYFSVETNVPCNCKTDTVNAPYVKMKITLNGTGTTSHDFAFPLAVDYPYSWYIKCVPSSDPENPIPVKTQFNTRLLSDYQPDYPRTMHLYKWWEPDSYEIMAKYDVVVAFGVKEAIQKARKINPDLKVLRLYPFSYGSDYESEFRAASNDTANALYNCLICNSEDSILIEEFWNHPMYNLANPACVDYIANKIQKRWSEDLLYFDGMFFDRVHESLSWMWNDMDLDRDGIPDENADIDAAWKAGVISLLTKIREKAPNAPIAGNDATPDFSPFLNGKLFEVFLRFYLEGWWNDYNGFMRDYIGWSKGHRTPWNLSMISLGGSGNCFEYFPGFTCPQSVLEETRANYQKMRFGLATTLMGDGTYLYDIESPVWGQTWWYDEYDVSLGNPTGPAVKGTVWKREFEKGMALVNPTSDTVHVNLNKTYWTFFGTQAPEVNNGSAVTEIHLPPRDGRILLKNKPDNPLGIELPKVKKLLFYPNPATAFINVRINENATVEILTIQGLLLKKKQVSPTDNIITVNELTSGSYVLKIVSGTNVFSEILIVE